MSVSVLSVRKSRQEYDGLGPIMDIKDHLNGKIACEGVIYGPLGRVSSRFVAEFEAEWKGDSGVMREVFHYDSGSVQHREWRLQLDEGRRGACGCG
jgi:hypothetical protein